MRIQRIEHTVIQYLYFDICTRYEVLICGWSFFFLRKCQNIKLSCSHNPTPSFAHTYPFNASYTLTFWEHLLQHQHNSRKKKRTFTSSHCMDVCMCFQFGYIFLWLQIFHVESVLWNRLKFKKTKRASIIIWEKRSHIENIKVTLVNVENW